MFAIDDGYYYTEDEEVDVEREDVEVEDDDIIMKCPRSECGYEWTPNVAEPKCCPYCRRYLPRDAQPITSGELTELKREMFEPEPITSEDWNDEVHVDGTELLAKIKAVDRYDKSITDEIMFGGSVPQPTHCPDCENPIPECKCEDKSIELTEKGDTRK